MYIHLSSQKNVKVCYQLGWVGGWSGDQPGGGVFLRFME